MAIEPPHNSRRSFVAQLGRAASVLALAGCTGTAQSETLPAASALDPRPSGAWDLSWLDQLAHATDRAVFDWPSLGNPADPIVLEIAGRYLDNCAAAYRAGSYRARVVLNARSRGIPAALTDDAWQRYSLGTEYDVKDPATGGAAERNPFWRRAPGHHSAADDASQIPTIEELVHRGAIVLVCDFALGHLSKRLAARTGQSAETVHQALRSAFIPGAYAVPSGIFGLTRAQNAGCAYVRM